MNTQSPRYQLGGHHSVTLRTPTLSVSSVAFAVPICKRVGGMEENPPAISNSKLFRARVEFRHFVEQVSLQHAASLGRRGKRFRALEEVFTFQRFPRAEDALQFYFGTRALPHQTIKGAAAGEDGPTILYSLAPAGEVITLIYPARSDLNRAGEDCIALRAGYYTSYQLRTRLARDLRDLAAYGHVTGLDGRPTWRERLRIKWLHWTRGLGMGGAGVKPSAASNQVQDLTGLALRTTAKAAAATIGLSLAATAAIALLAWLGYSELPLKAGGWLGSSK